MVPNVSRILVPTDFSKTADAALAYAKTLADHFGASLHLVHVFSDAHVATNALEAYGRMSPDLRDRALADARACLLKRLDAAEKRRFGGTRAIVMGLTAQQIVKYAADHAIDLIVMGTHGRRGVAHLLLGSVAEHVVRISSCPVLTVRDAHGAQEKEPAGRVTGTARVA